MALLEMIRPDRWNRQLDLRFSVVPAYDLPISLAAIANPVRHELPSSWGRDAKQALPPSVRRELGFFFGGPIPLGLLPIHLVPDLRVDEPAQFLTALQGLDLSELIAALLRRRTAERGLAAAIRRNVRGRSVSQADLELIAREEASLPAATRRRFRAVLQDPKGARDRYLALLASHGEGWFSAHYPEQSLLLHQRAKQGRRSIGKLPATEVIARVTGGFTLRSPSVRSATLVPSYYASPFVYVVKEGKDALLVYGVRPHETGEARAPVDQQTVKVLKALADETRLRILQLLAQRPLYGQQLAEMLGVSHPTISHHMAQLRIAGLTRTEMAEDGSQTYTVRADTLEHLFAELRAAFVDGAPTSERGPV